MGTEKRYRVRDLFADSNPPEGLIYFLFLALPVFLAYRLTKWVLRRIGAEE